MKPVKMWAVVKRNEIDDVFRVQQVAIRRAKKFARMGFTGWNAVPVLITTIKTRPKK